MGLMALRRWRGLKTLGYAAFLTAIIAPGGRCLGRDLRVRAGPPALGKRPVSASHAFYPARTGLASQSQACGGDAQRGLAVRSHRDRDAGEPLLRQLLRDVAAAGSTAR